MIFLFRCNRTFSTEVESASQSPVWGAKHVFSDIEREELLYAKLDITVWNFSHAPKHECIGKILVWLHFFQRSTDSKMYIFSLGIYVNLRVVSPKKWKKGNGVLLSRNEICRL